MNAQHEAKNSTKRSSIQTMENREAILMTDTLIKNRANEGMSLQDDVYLDKDKDKEMFVSDSNNNNDNSENEDAESYCVICLNSCEDRTVLETCRHEFCFHCILQWSMVSHSCPLCVQIFESCIHNIQDDEHYSVHRFEPLASNSKKSASSSSTSATTNRDQRQMEIPYGIIRQLYGPPQLRRRFRNHRNVQGHESTVEQSVVEQQQQALERRRHVYRHRLFVKHMGANRISGFQQITPESFRIFPHRLDRLIPWIRRELQAILSLDNQPNSDSSSLTSTPSMTENCQDSDRGLELIREYIIAVLKRFDLQTDQAQDLLRDFLYEHTEQFVHELMGFARSPYSIEAYDRVAQYDTTPSSTSEPATATRIEELETRTGDNMEHRNRDRTEYHTREHSSGNRERDDRRGRSHKSSEVNDRDDQDRHRQKRSHSSGSHESEPYRFAKRHRGVREFRDNESPTRHSYSDRGSGSKDRNQSRSRGRSKSRSKSRDSASHLERASKSRDTSVEKVAESSKHSNSPQVPERDKRKGKGPAVVSTLNDTNSSINPNDPTNRDTVIAILQAKLKREREIYDAKMNNRRTT
ncbi:hypothetical protein BGZ49_009391 [Haplosporangium sp. Z 27]|nr:hypothetical protein BGZ49_009391 [Haplosporangium sp. Z 27]